jgi:hypothetical protein
LLPPALGPCPLAGHVPPIAAAPASWVAQGAPAPGPAGTPGGRKKRRASRDAAHGRQRFKNPELLIPLPRCAVDEEQENREMPRELIEPRPGDKRYVRRSKTGQFKGPMT